MPKLCCMATLAPSTCRLPASPRSCHTSSAHWARPAKHKVKHVKAHKCNDRKSEAGSLLLSNYATVTCKTKREGKCYCCFSDSDVLLTRIEPNLCRNYTIIYLCHQPILCRALRQMEHGHALPHSPSSWLVRKPNIITHSHLRMHACMHAHMCAQVSAPFFVVVVWGGGAFPLGLFGHLETILFSVTN